MNCRKALSLLYEYLDRELEDRTLESVKEHLAACKHCFETYHFEEQLQVFIKEKGREDVSGLVDVLKHKVCELISTLPPEDNGSAPKEESPGFFRYRSLLAAATLAGIAVLALVLYFAGSNRTLHAAITPLLTVHAKAVKGEVPMDIVTADAHAVDSCLSRRIKIPQELIHSDSECTLWMARAQVDSLTSEGHLVYRVKGREVSVFVRPALGFEPFGFKKFNCGKHQALYGESDGSSLLAWQCHDVWCIAVGQLSQSEILAFARHLSDYSASEAH